MKQEGFPCTGKFPDSWVQVRAVESQKIGQSRDLEGRQQRKLYFSIHKQLTDCGPNQMAVLGNEEKHTEASGAEGGPGVLREAWHKNLSSAHNPHSAESRPREPKEEHRSPVTYREGPGSRDECTQDLQHRG